MKKAIVAAAIALALMSGNVGASGMTLEQCQGYYSMAKVIDEMKNNSVKKSEYRKHILEKVASGELHPNIAALWFSMQDDISAGGTPEKWLGVCMNMVDGKPAKAAPDTKSKYVPL